MADAKPAGSERLEGGLDANLLFYTSERYWAGFFAAQRCEISRYVDLTLLTHKLLDHALDFSYLPSANCFFLRNDPDFAGVASAKSPRRGVPEQSSVLIVAAASPVTDWHDLRGARLGYINTFCTTSYFAPSILLAREGLMLEAFFDAFPVAAWQGQIDAVVAGTIDATMVYEDVWLARADNAKTTRILARLDDLPTPPFIVRREVPAAFTSQLKARLLACAPPVKPGDLYAGFAPYQGERMQRFFAAMETIPGLAKMGAGARA